MEHEVFIRTCHALAVSAGKRGNHTFGAVLVHNGEVIMEAENTVNTDKNDFRHAEYNLVMKSRQQLPAEVLIGSTLYTSTAPCLLCTAVILTARIPRIVFSVSDETFAKLVPGEHKYIPCTEIAARLGGTTKVHGPVLEDEGLKVFQYWGGDFTPLDQILRRARDP